eukprot:s1_g85.t1
MTNKHPRYVAYYRVSTDKQGRSGLGLDAQRQAVTAYMATVGGTLAGEFMEIESGNKNDRPEICEALELCRKHRATLLIAKLDRLARNVRFIAELMEGGVDFVACDMPEANRLTIHILAAVAEHEREMISQRTKTALQAAKARGMKLGNPNPKLAAIRGAAKQRERADRFAENLLPVIQSIQEVGVTSLSGVAKALNARGIKTQRHRAWTATGVKNILKRGKVWDEAAKGLANRAA